MRRPWVLRWNAAGIPSIIYGMWGLFVFAPLFGDYIEPWVNDHIGAMPFIGPFFSGPPWHRCTHAASFWPSWYSFIASVMRDVFEVVPACSRNLHTLVPPLGSDVECVLPTQNRVSAASCWVWARAGRNHGGDFVIGNAHS